MSQMTIAILDADRAIHSQPHGSFVHTLIPALSDDPETIEELRHAMRRFMSPDEEDDPINHWRPGDRDEPFDAGICIVDLTARLIVFQSTYCDIMRHGQVTFDEIDHKRPRWIPYHLANEWLITEQLDGWRSLADERRLQRRRNPSFDTRAVLYGKVAPFIVHECVAARGGSTDSDGVWIPPAGWQWREVPDRPARGRPLTILDGIAEIHARWLMSPRDDLHGQSPRQLLHAKHADLSLHLQDRELQWSSFGNCPPPLWRESIAYRCGGYGTHEIVLYYELMRHLLHECWDLIVETATEHAVIDTTAAIEQLGKIQQEWLHTPNQQEYVGKSPVQVIECERLRLPLGLTGKEAMIDCDCPLCQMMADSGPSFWHLDGCNMDDDFPFALFEHTREEWQAKQQEWAEYDGELNSEQAERTAADEGEKLVLTDDATKDGPSSSLWQRTMAGSHSAEHPVMTLFGLGCHLAELIEDLRGPGLDRRRSRGTAVDQGAGDPIGNSKSDQTTDPYFWIDTLNRDFANLRQALGDPARALVEPVTSRFTEHLLALAEKRPNLRAKCLDLDRQLFDFARRLNGELDTADDAPF